MNVLQIVEAHLRSIGADGLVNRDMECGCVLEDFEPCGCISAPCEPAKKHLRCGVNGCEYCSDMASVGADFWMVPMEEQK